jgi:hypothetical protein
MLGQVLAEDGLPEDAFRLREARTRPDAGRPPPSDDGGHHIGLLQVLADRSSQPAI